MLDKQIELAPHDRSSLRDDNPAHQALLALLAYMASSNGTVDDQELAFLERLLPDRRVDDLRAWAVQYGEAGAPDFAYLFGVIRQPQDQWTCLRFAARMAWKDGSVDEAEQVLLTRLSAGFKLPDGAVERVLREMAPFETERFSKERIVEALKAPNWDTVQMAGGDLVSTDLQAVSPDSAGIVARIGLDRTEIAALGTGGIVARFRDGPAFVAWDDLVSYSRPQSLGAALTLHTEDGRAYHLVDSRLGGLVMVFDRLLDSMEPMKAESTVEITADGVVID